MKLASPITCTRFVCYCTIFISVFVLAQSRPAQLGDRPNVLKIAQERHPVLSSNLYQMRLGLPVDPPETKVIRATASRRRSSSSGPSFATAVPYPSGGFGPNAVAMADVNGDGKPDLIVANWCTDGTCVASSVAVLLGKGDGTFQAAVTYGSGGLYADSVAIADFNGDGKPDIVVGNCGFPKKTACDASSSGNVAVLLNAGNGTFSHAVSYSLGTNVGATSVAVADLGNGTLDLIVAAGSAGNSTVDVLLGNGNGTFGAATSYNSGGFTALSVAVADVNDDGKPDLVVANWCTDATCVASSVGVLLGNGDGTFGAATTYDSGGFLANSVAIGDVNGDGKPDVVVSNANTSTIVAAGDVGVLLGNGDGTFQTAVAYSRSGVGAASVVISDVNGDGKLDLAVANCGTTGMGCGNDDGDLVTLLTEPSRHRSAMAREGTLLSDWQSET
jgi:FG-GAP-like repeat